MQRDVVLNVNQTACHRYFRAQPPFIPPSAIYTNRVIGKAVQSVVEDGLALRCVPDRLWTDAKGNQRTVNEARALNMAWCTNPDHQAIPTLQQALERMMATEFERVSQFLHNPEWEATNNGAERGGRAFRHRQAPRQT